MSYGSSNVLIGKIRLHLMCRSAHALQIAVKMQLGSTETANSPNTNNSNFPPKRNRHIFSLSHPSIGRMSQAVDQRWEFSAPKFVDFTKLQQEDGGDAWFNDRRDSQGDALPSLTNAVIAPNSATKVSYSCERIYFHF